MRERRVGEEGTGRREGEVRDFHEFETTGETLLYSEKE